MQSSYTMISICKDLVISLIRSKINAQWLG